MRADELYCPPRSSKANEVCMCWGEYCAWWHKEKGQCSVVSMAKGLTQEPPKEQEAAAGALDLPQALLDKLKKEGFESFADIGKAGGIASLEDQGVITSEEAGIMTKALEQWKEFMGSFPPEE